jgi:hypothetical protein
VKKTCISRHAFVKNAKTQDRASLIMPCGQGERQDGSHEMEERACLKDSTETMVGRCRGGGAEKPEGKASSYSTKDRAWHVFRVAW